MKSSSRILCLLLALVFISPVFADDTTQAAQQKLKTLGLYDGTVDGQMGSQTNAAIRRYQVYNKLPITGELNTETIDHLGLRNTVAKTGTVSARTATQPSKATSLANIYAGGPFITVGAPMQVQILKQAKENLRILGFYRGPIDGDPSAEFVNALKQYQRSAKFKSNGRLDKTTLRALDLYEPVRDDGRY